MYICMYVYTHIYTRYEKLGDVVESLEAVNFPEAELFLKVYWELSFRQSCITWGYLVIFGPLATI